MLCVALSLLMLLLCGCESIVVNADAPLNTIYINEVMSSNSHTLVDETLGTPDWIEIYNASKQSVDLKGYGLSDNVKEPHKWTFPAISIAPGEYLLVYACKQDAQMCSGFALSKGGESLYLSDAFYNMLQIVSLPPMETDISYARDKNGEFGYCAAPTPGKENGDDIVKSMGEVRYAGSDSLAISEILPKNTAYAQCEDGKYYPYVKLKNTAASPVSLASFYLSDARAETMKWQMPDVTLAPGAYALIYLSGKDKNSGELHAPFKLGKEDASLFLSDMQGQICSSMSWSLDLPEDVAVIANETYTAFPMPMGDNDTRSFTDADFHIADSAEPVLLNEVLVKNKYSITDEYGERSAWVELYNSSEQSVSLYGYYLSDNEENPLKWAFPEDALIEGGAYTLVYLDGKSEAQEALHTDFSLSLSDGVILLTNKNGLSTQRFDLDPGLGDNISVGLDANGALAYFTTPTPLAKNSTHAFSSMGELSLTDLNGVYISEVCAVNAAKSGKADWIELHNASSRDVNLKGWHISDDPDEPERFTFSDFTLEAGAYKTITASKESTEQKGVTAPFSISASGETLLLFDDSMELRDVFETGALRNGISSGRSKESSSRVFFTSSTPGAENAAPAAESYALPPVFSSTELYHDDAFQLSIKSASANSTIYYTLDGSKPTTESSVYSEPLTISGNAIVKAKAVASGKLDSFITVATYVFGVKHTLPVVCLSTDSESFDQVYSVIDRWEKVEREAYCEYYEADGKLGTCFPCGIRVNGASTLLARQKSLSIFLRGGYGVSQSNYPFFPESDVSVYHSLSIRNSGQDRERARMRDSLFAKAVKGLNIETVETRPVIAYINGQYWGIYDLNENQNEDYMATHYDVDPNAVDIIRRNETRLAGQKSDMKRIRDYAVGTDLSDNTKFQQFSEWVDVDYFTDYLIAQSYFANGDMFNQKYWRSQDYSVKWRPVFYDLDLAFSASNPTRNILPSYFKTEGVPSQDGSLTNMDIFCGLRKNAAWCEHFCERYVYVVYNILTPERMTGILDAYAAQLEPEMDRHIKKWGDPSSLSAWKKNVESLRSCILERRDYALKALKSEFGITDAQMQAYISAAQQQSAQSE